MTSDGLPPRKIIAPASSSALTFSVTIRNILSAVPLPRATSRRRISITRAASTMSVITVNQDSIQDIAVHSGNLGRPLDNKLLSSLPRDQFDLLAPHLITQSLAQGLVLM